MAINNLGYVLLIEGKIREAEPLVERGRWAGRRHVLGENRRGTMRAISNIGMSAPQGNLTRRSRIRAQGLILCRRVLGDDDPWTLTAISDLGSLLMEQGEFVDDEEEDEEERDEAERLATRRLGTTKACCENPSRRAGVASQPGTFLRRCEVTGRRRDVFPWRRWIARARTERKHPQTLYAMDEHGNAVHGEARALTVPSRYSRSPRPCERALPAGHPLTANGGLQPGRPPAHARTAATKPERCLASDRSPPSICWWATSIPKRSTSCTVWRFLLHRQGEVERAEPMFREAV